MEGCREAADPMTKATDAIRKKKDALHLVFPHSQHHSLSPA